MATTALSQGSTRPAVPVRRYDHLFFSAMAALVLVLVLVGFARTYFLAGMLRAPLPSPIIHVHGALFSLWIVMFVTQISLVSGGRVALHRTLGVAGFVLASLMVVIGVMAATNSLSRNFAPPGGLDAQTFYIIPLTDMLIFAVLMMFAYRARYDSAAHKRLILLATVSLMVAPTARPPLSVITGHPHFDSFFCWIFILLLVGYDLWSTHKVHRVTIWGSLFLMVVQQVRVPIGFTGSWHTFAGWVQGMMR